MEKGLHNETSNSTEQEEDEDVKKTIDIMESLGTMLHPDHLHSFRPVISLLTPGFLFSANKSCAACDSKLSVLGSGNAAATATVKCVACGALAHRSCAFRKGATWKRKCEVNMAKLASSSSSGNNDMGGSESGTSVSACGECSKDKTKDDNDTSPTSALECEVSAAPIERKVTPRWTADGPPKHWADNGIVVGDPTEEKNTASTIASGDAVVESNSAEEATAIKVKQQPRMIASFPKVAKALQENVLMNMQRRKLDLDDEKKYTKKVRRRKVSGYPGARSSKANSTADTEATATSDDDNVQTSNTHDDDERRSAQNFKLAAVAGGIAGGVAGLALAGPAGACAGYMAAGSFMVEGAATIGVVAAGIATGGITGNQIQGHLEEKRIIAMGEAGTSREVILIRPNIRTDPVWDRFCQETKDSFKPNRKDKKNMKRCDSDILKSEENELTTREKIVLLVSRALNDKTSLPGHVYRELMQVFEERCIRRTELCSTNKSVVGPSPRARRDDAHAVIKHVTAALVGERPEFGSSPYITEETASAVEGLVFGQLYDAVFEEIVEETFQQDVQFWRKITHFEDNHGEEKEALQSLISGPAVKALNMLPHAHSVEEKLYYCVQFLDLVSAHFTEATATHACADSLLKMVSQHLVLMENRGCSYAQVAFLEEFARDDQLLRGREGYALVTLQACLQFLQMSDDLKEDVFNDDDNELGGAEPSDSTEDATAFDDENVANACDDTLKTDIEDATKDSAKAAADKVAETLADDIAKAVADDIAKNLVGDVAETIYGAVTTQAGDENTAESDADGADVVDDITEIGPNIEIAGAGGEDIVEAVANEIAETIADELVAEAIADEIDSEIAASDNVFETDQILSGAS